MRAMKIWIMAVSIALSGSVYAGAYDMSDDSGIYAGAGVGSSSIDVSDSGFSFDDTDTGWKVFAGYKVNDYYSAEAAWVDFGDFSDTVLGIPVKLSIDGFALSGLGTYPINDSVDVFGRLGIWHWNSDAKVAGLSGDDSGTDFMFGVGGSYSFTDAVAFRLEWERYKADSDDADLLSVSGVFSFR